MRKLELVKISGIVSGVGFTETFADGSGSYSEKICETLYDTGKDNKDAAESKKWANTIVTAVNNTYHKGINPEAVPVMYDLLKAISEYGILPIQEREKIKHLIQKATL